MPLFHVGGIVRNLLAPVLSGGSSIMCSGFDALAFWSLASHFQATWYVLDQVRWLVQVNSEHLPASRYYAAPTIHHAILAAQPNDLVPGRDLSIRMICNAAGGLLPSLAVELRDRFNNAVVLPSYGMTE